MSESPPFKSIGAIAVMEGKENHSSQGHCTANSQFLCHYKIGKLSSRITSQYSTMFLL